MPWIPRDFYQKVQLSIKVNEKEPLKWRPMSYESARAKFKFNIFWRKNGNIAEYRLSLVSPGMLWNQMTGLPGNSSFEETRTKDFHALRLCKDGLPQSRAFIKIPVPQ